jgi:hypothetical protein
MALMPEVADHSLSGLIRHNYGALCTWGAAIGIALIGFFVTAGSQYHQLAVGILSTLVSLFVAMSVVEGIWVFVERLFGVEESLR